MSFIKKINKYWEFLEQKYPCPKFVKKIDELEFYDFKKHIDNKNEIYIKKIIKDMYVNNTAFILKKAAPKNFKNIIIDLANFYKKKQKTNFYKMLNGTPNFHRVIDKKITKKYSLYAIKHSFYFYNWNIKFRLEKKLKQGAYRHWRYIKNLAGNSKKKFEKNIPSDGQIDRLQVVRYPAGGGQLRDHVDPRKNQRVVTGLIMSEKGKDFTKGGFYFKSSKTKKINIENNLKEGDAVIFYGSIAHGVEPVDPEKKLNWKSNAGRWFVGMFVNDSDHLKNRITAKDLTGSVKKKY